MQQGILKGSICNSPDLKTKGGDGFYNIDTSDPSRSKNEKKKNSVEDPSRDVLNSSLDSHFLKDLLSRSGSEIKERTPHVLTPTLENPLTYPPVVLPLDAVLMKGFQRACILCPSTEGLLMSSRTSSPINDDNKDGNDTHELKGNKIDTSSPADSYSNLQVFEIVIHAGESFLKQKDIDISIDPSDTNKKRSNKIVNFSTGWQHSILVLENKK